MDYCMPRADDLPIIASVTENTACTHNPIGVKGCGETGTIASPATVMNAVVDALAPYGITHVDMPASPQRIWQTIQAAPHRQAAE
jgi:carbon-monoxide dehydrogenase large subunit